MSKAVVYVLLAIAFLLFIVFSQNNRQSHRSNPSLSRRLGYDVPLPTFDPLVTKIERLKEEKETGNLRSPTNSENKTFEGEFGDAEDYFGYERKLNITLRLMVLFPFLDKAPKDGFVSFKELVNWNIQQAMDRLNYRTRNELVSHDNDRDGAITLREYLPQSS
ncbi:hypothetical protein L1049_019634 [Liquidambar formosana]|uniref:Uncharacterized protein n=1 Tax=Liquidambar formosana TaxID=63359 RepID=A0AAP0XAB1_LIQFO